MKKTPIYLPYPNTLHYATKQYEKTIYFIQAKT